MTSYAHSYTEDHCTVFIEGFECIGKIIFDKKQRKTTDKKSLQKFEASIQTYQDIFRLETEEPLIKILRLLNAFRGKHGMRFKGTFVEREKLIINTFHPLYNIKESYILNNISTKAEFEKSKH